MKNKRILVTGATGLIGYNLVKRLMNCGGVEVIALSRNKAKLEKCFSEFLGAPNFKCVAHDVSDKLPDIGVVDLIFHAAGPMERKIIDNFPVDVVLPNLTGTINCLEHMKALSAKGNAPRLVLFSSVTVYGNNTNADRTVSEEDTGITEALHSKNAPYSQSKRMSEVIATSYAKQYESDVVIARLSTVYGETYFRPDTAFFQFYDSAFKGENITINSPGIARRDNIYIDDAIEGLITIALKGKKGEAYNVSSNGDGGNFAAIDEIASQILTIANRKSKAKNNDLKVEYRETGDFPRAAGLKLDNSKLKGLGWSIKTGLEEGLTKTFEKMEENDTSR